MHGLEDRMITRDELIARRSTLTRVLPSSKELMAKYQSEGKHSGVREMAKTIAQMEQELEMIDLALRAL
jgi:hypothetical protein